MNYNFIGCFKKSFPNKQGETITFYRFYAFDIQNEDVLITTATQEVFDDCKELVMGTPIALNIGFGSAGKAKVMSVQYE